MTSTSTSTTSFNGTTAPSRTPLLAAIGVGTSAVLTAIGTFLGPNDTGDASRDDVSTWLTCVGIAAVAATIGFGLVARGAARGNAGRRAAITGGLSLVSVAAFWSGLPMVLAAVALACALTDRDARGAFSALSKLGLALAGLAAVAAAVLAFTG